MKEVIEIEVPKEWEITNDWDSHRPLLYLALKNKGGDVIEMGSGKGSTLLLDKECYNSDRKFVSIENNPELGQGTIYGIYIHTNDYLLFPTNFPELFKRINIGILFIDCAPADLRKELIKQYQDVAEVIIVHDTEESAEYVYGMKEILSTFKYRLDFKPEELPATTAVSNFINVEDWV